MSSPEIEPIAIVGLGCRFPGGADTPEKLWQLAYEGRQCWEEVPSNRYNWHAFHHPDPEARGTHNARGGFFLQQDPAVFDANFFAISAAEAAAIDPQQRLLLEVSYEALENAGMPLEAIRGTQTGVYVALVSRDYDRMIYKDPSQIPKYHLTGCGDATACGRISYTFDLKGPCVSMDTGCSGSMVALHLACQALRLGETNAAIVAGTNLLLGPDMTIAMSALHMINENGRCYPFDSRGAGYGRAEGVAALVLKRQADAVRDGDPIRAVIRNTGINQDGKTNGIMLPSFEAQQQLTSTLYRQAGLDPNYVCYIEAHGTGTQAGDAAEVTSIKQVFASAARTRERPLFLGSIKANLGHSESTSGLAGVIKTVIALENATIPPLAALETLKPDLHSLLESTKIIIPSKPVSWPHEGTRLASVNSFGFGGTNAHVILESAPSFELQTQPTNGFHTDSDCICVDTDSDNGRPQLFIVSAKSRVSLEAAIYNVRDWVSRHGATYIKRQELVKTLCHRRSIFNWRASIVASSQPGILSALEKPHTTKSWTKVQVVFLFTGQGAQYARMGKELVGLDSVFSHSLDQSQTILTELGASWRLLEELLREESASSINSSELSQPATTAIQIALVDMLAEMNVRPSAVLGHSSGEVAAAYAAGILGRREALTIAYHKGFVAGWCRNAISSQGAMLAVGLGEAQVMPYLQHGSSSAGQCTIACVNSPSSVTLSGDQAALAEVQQRLDRDSIFNRRLKVDIAYHSHHMQAVAGQFGHCLRDLPAKKAAASVRFYSSVTGSETSTALGASYWVDNLVSQVRFGPALEELTEKYFASSSNSLVLLEMGPHSALQGPIRQIMNSLERPAGRWTYISSLVRNKDAHIAALEMIGGLFEHGVQVDLTADLLALPREAHPVVTDLPPYPWDHSNTYWQESRLSKDYRFRHHAPHDLLGLRLDGTSTIEPIFRHVLSVDELPWLQEHIIDGFALYPGSAFLCMAIEALKQVSQDRGGKRKIAKYVFRDVSFSKALVVPSSPASIEVLISLKPSRLLKGRMGVAWEEFRVTSVSADGTWNEHCRGSIHAEFHEEHELEDRTGSAGRFAVIRELHLGEQQAIGRLKVPDIAPLMPAQHMQPHVIHPTVFDAFMHIVLPLYHRHCSQGPVMLTSIGEASISADILNKPGDELLVACRLAHAGRRHGSVEVSIFQRDAQGDLIQYVYRQGTLLVPQLEKSASTNQWLAASINGSSIEETSGFHTSGRPLQLHFKTPGLLDSAVFVPVDGLLDTLEPDEVSVKVYAHAVNRVDIAIASDRAEPTEVMMGEFAGVVVAAGPLCEGAYRPGDRVCGWGSRPYTNIARVKCHMVHRLDDAISFIEGASIPIAFQSAAYALTRITRLERDQTILIHGAAGAVGQAAISIAQHVGAEIFATVGSPEKKQLLAEQKGIPTSKILSSRTAAFRDDILNLTNGRGVDVVINCSSGDLMDESIPCVADFGYLIDLTKSKIPLSMDRGLRKNVTFASIDMRLLATQRPRQLKELFAKVMELYQEQSLTAIAPITTIPITDLSAGFRLVQSQRYAGKIVLAADETVLVKQLAPKPELPHLTADGTYAVVGGSAALNRMLCSFLEARGAEHVLSVQSPNPAAKPDAQVSSQELSTLNGVPGQALWSR
ncbi:uncharacterized protein ANIA_10430 [Aspergillus nidulans FGSC A4]|uniref:Polyketide synthase, putative (JCVI) n=1 Tax=Emericella nidulans (strain FGSC A4 / ATCC 38163 / CBS 112.46 / NRRL 194 / M139) TaxID=227321 RepID=C8V467_EMENI|nr:hypothetical protein [Aspergillus nidulans FGSC A4]CBF75781.1 TPA: polyketide synthase, putative (JCVI) [Aspergillus nidulans FGSC A4]